MSPPAAPLRVVTLIDGPPVQGGGERFAAEVAKRLDPERFDRTLCISRWAKDGPLGIPPGLAAVEDAGVRVLGLGRRSALAVWDWRPLYRLLRKGAVDVLHSHKFGSNAWASAIGTAARVPALVAHEHSWSYEGDAVRRFVDSQLIGRAADAVIAVSSEDRRRMIEIEGIPAEKIYLMPCGIPRPEGPSPSDLRKELQIPEEAPVIGSVGGLRPEKAFDVLIDAAGRLRNELPQLTVLIAGDGPERARLEADIAGANLGETVRLLGFRADTPDVIATLDVAVCCSDREGSPLSVLEYMQAARPVVATAVGGIPDMISDGEEGLLVAPRDPSALATAIGGLLRDREAARAFGERARERQHHEFDIAVNVRELEGLYESLAGRTPTQSSSRSGNAAATSGGGSE
jgi:glycosyltransferase involved in cell wall biosynthesis